MSNESSFVVPPHAIVLAVCGANSKLNMMPLQCTEPEQPPGFIWLGIRLACHSNSLIKEDGCFVAAFPSEEFLYETDRAGCTSGRDEDKFARYNIEHKPGEVVSTPVLTKCRLNLECKLADTVKIDEGRDRFVGEIVRIHVWPDCVNEQGEPDLNKCKPIVQKDGVYWSWDYEKELEKFYYTNESAK